MLGVWEFFWSPTAWGVSGPPPVDDSDAGTLPGLVPPLANTDADLLFEACWRVIEDTSFSSALWSLDEVAEYFNERMDRFNRDTNLMLANVPVATAEGQRFYLLPDDWIATFYATWRDAATRRETLLTKSDRHAGLFGMPSDQRPSRPIIMDQHPGGSGIVELFPTPTEPGEIVFVYTSTLEPLRFLPSEPDLVDLPNDFCPYLVYGVLADMLSKEGRGFDPVRAQYCQSRYEEGVALAAIFLAGYVQ